MSRSKAILTFLLLLTTLSLENINSKSIIGSYLHTRNPVFKFNSRWTIENYLQLPQKDDERFFSPSIESLDENCPIKFRIDLRYGLNGGSYAGTTRVYTVLYDLPNKVKQVYGNFEITIVNSKSERTNFTKKFEKSLLNGTENSFPYVPFITKEELEDNKDQILPNGHLTLEFVAEATVQWSAGSVFYPDTVISLVEFENQFAKETLQQLDLFGNTSSDLVITSGGKKFACHKEVVAHRSPYLKSLVSEGETVIDVSDDMSQLELADFLRFIYTGHASNLRSTCLRLHTVADKYGVYQLRKLCENVYMANLLANGKIPSEI